MELKLERIYTKPVDLAGYRILVDRLWPRGMSKVKAHLDLWAKNIGPSTELRQWFDHDPEKFLEFKRRYLLELQHNPEFEAFVQRVQQQLMTQNVILLYGAKDTVHNQAVILFELLNQHIANENNL